MPRAPSDVSSASATPSTTPISYKAVIAELEAPVASMEFGELPLRASPAAYRRGAELVKYCQQVPERVEQQVRVLDGDALKPLGDDSNTNEQGDAWAISPNG